MKNGGGENFFFFLIFFFSRFSLRYMEFRRTKKGEIFSELKRTKK